MSLSKQEPDVYEITTRALVNKFDSLISTTEALRREMEKVKVQIEQEKRDRAEFNDMRLELTGAIEEAMKNNEKELTFSLPPELTRGARVLVRRYIERELRLVLIVGKDEWKIEF